MIVSVQIWRNKLTGTERVYGLGEPFDKNATPLLDGARHTYVRNESRAWVDYENSLFDLRDGLRAPEHASHGQA